jgi:hypothetical protein
MKNEKTLEGKLFFVVKYSIVAWLEGAVFVAIILLFGSINFWQTLVLSLLNLTGTTFIITRYLESYIDKLSFFVCGKVSDYPKLRRIVFKYV